MEISKDNILVDLVNFSTYEKPLGSRYFKNKYDGLGTRELTLMIIDLVDCQDKYMVCSKDDGYYIPKNIDEAEHGILFIASRENKLRERRQRLENLKQQLFFQQDPTLFGVKE